MPNLVDSYTQLQPFPNGEQVARRMAQLLDLSLQPEMDHLILSVQHVLNVIELHESQLLGRTDLQIREEGSILKRFKQAMYDSSTDDWVTLRKDHHIESITDKETQRIIADASGLVRNTNFLDWVIGKEEKPIDPETTLQKVQGLGKSKEGE